CRRQRTFHVCFHASVTRDPYTLSLHDALPICVAGTADAVAHRPGVVCSRQTTLLPRRRSRLPFGRRAGVRAGIPLSTRDAEEVRSEEHTSELQSRSDLVCRLLLEKKKL